MRTIPVTACLLITAWCLSSFPASAGTCPVRIGFAELLAIGRQHGTAEYYLMFVPPAQWDGTSGFGPYLLEITAEKADGSHEQASINDVTVGYGEMATGTSEIVVIPFASGGIRSFRIDSARDPSGIVTCSDDESYTLGSGGGSESFAFDDGPESHWPLEHFGSVDVIDAQLLTRAEPAYPAQARNIGAQGDVRILVIIDADGSLESASVFTSSGNDLLDQAAVAGAQASTYAAARLLAEFGGKPIRSAYLIEYTFRLNG
jgi:TonB family protein